MPNTKEPFSRTYNKIFFSTGMVTFFLLAPTVFAVSSIIKNLYSYGPLKLKIIEKYLEGPTVERQTKAFDNFVNRSPFLKRMNLESKHLKEDFSESFSKVQYLFFLCVAFSIACQIISSFISLAVVALAIGIYVQKNKHNGSRIENHLFQEEANNSQYLFTQTAQENPKRDSTKTQQDQKSENNGVPLERQKDVSVIVSCQNLTLVFDAQSKSVINVSHLYS